MRSSAGKEGATLVEEFTDGGSTDRSGLQGKYIDPETGERTFTPRVAHPRKWS